MKSVLMAGPHRKVMGGVSSVVNVYYNTGIIRNNRVFYVSTYIDGSKVAQSGFYFINFFKAVVILLFCGIDIVHLHSSSRGSFWRKSYIALVAKALRKKVIFHIHGAEFHEFYEKQSSIKKRYITKVLNLADSIIALSQVWKERISHITKSSRKITIIHNPILIPPFKRKQNESIDVKILYMGRLEQRKGVYDLLKAAQKIISQIGNVEFHLCGDGDIDKVKRIVNDNKLNKYIKIHGWVWKKELYYRNADIFVLPSYNEGLPMSVLEAASFCLPVVAGRAGGIEEIIENKKSGFVIDPGNVEELEKCLLQLIHSKTLRIKFGVVAFETIKEKFNTEKIIGQVEALYETLVQNKLGAPCINARAEKR